METTLTGMLEGTVLKNVGSRERWLSGLSGLVMAWFGLAQKSVGGLLVALSGLYLLYRGLSGHCFLYELLAINTRPVTDLRRAQEPPPPSVKRGDEVTESSWESFPTSDPPAWTLGKRDDD